MARPVIYAADGSLKVPADISGDFLVYGLDGWSSVFDAAGRRKVSMVAEVVYATWDGATDSGEIDLTNGDLTITRNATNNNAWRSIRSTIGKSSGKWYWEVTYDVGGLNEHIHGVGSSALSTSGYVGSNATSYGWQSSGAGPLKWSNASSTSWGTAGAVNDVFMVALDMDNGKVWFGRNGTWFNSGDPAAGTTPAYSSLSGTIYAAAALFTSTRAATANFGASAFAHTPPAGFNSGLYT